MFLVSDLEAHCELWSSKVTELTKAMQEIIDKLPVENEQQLNRDKLTAMVSLVKFLFEKIDLSQFKH